MIDIHITYPPEAPIDHVLTAMPFIERLGVNVVGYGRSADDIDRLEAAGGEGGEKDGHRWVVLRVPTSRVEILFFMARPEPAP